MEPFSPIHDASAERAKITLDNTVSKLTHAVSKWNDNVMREKQVSNTLSSAVTSYQSYLNEINSTLETQLQKFVNHVETEEGYGAELEKLKMEFQNQVETERGLHAQVRQSYETYIAQLKALHESEKTKATEGERTARQEAEKRELEAGRQLEAGFLSFVLFLVFHFAGFCVVKAMYALDLDVSFFSSSDFSASLFSSQG